MNNEAKPSEYVNMSAYVALSCLIAFIVVITICLLKQFIWDPLLSKQFETIRPVLIESIRKFLNSFQQNQSGGLATFSTPKSNESPLLNNDNSTNSTSIQLGNENSTNKTMPRRTYGSSALSSYAYTNFGSEDIHDDPSRSYPIIHFSCEYNPSTFSIRLNIQNLRNMNVMLDSIRHLVVDRSAWIFVRFFLISSTPQQPYETSLQRFQDFIRFGETFNILTNVRAGDPLNHQIKFFLILSDGQTFVQLAESIYSMKDEQLTHILFLERVLPMQREKLASTVNDQNSNP